MQDHVLGVNAGTEIAVHFDAADLERFERQGLRGEHVAHLGGADAEGDRAEGAVGGGVRVAAGDGGARLGDALLGADDVDDALFAGGEVEVGDAEVIGVFPQRLHHFRGERILRRVLIDGRHDVVDRGERALREFHLQPEIAEHAEGLGRGHLVDEVGADEELRAAVREGADGVGVPDFLEEAFSHDENGAVVGGGRENCLWRPGLSKPHAGAPGERCADGRGVSGVR